MDLDYLVLVMKIEKGYRRNRIRFVSKLLSYRDLSTYVVTICCCLSFESCPLLMCFVSAFLFFVLKKYYDVI
jgi:hypothetical protein